MDRYPPYPPGAVIELSDGEDTDGLDESEDSFFNNYLNEDIPGSHSSPVPERTPAPYSSDPRPVISSFETCLAELLEVFPDICREHVQSLYNKLNRQDGPYAQTAAQVLIERILDGGNYPKEKDRIKELKRKRNDKHSDEEEAARWKYADMRDNAIEYSKVA